MDSEAFKSCKQRGLLFDGFNCTNIQVISCNLSNEEKQSISQYQKAGWQIAQCGQKDNKIVVLMYEDKEFRDINGKPSPQWKHLEIP